MKAILVDKEKNLVWSEVPDPAIRADEVLIKVYAAGLNRADLFQRQGHYPSPEGWPEWMGLEVAGIIEQVGGLARSSSPYRVGDRVCALLGGGGYAEYVAVPYKLLMPVPQGFSMAEAAAIPEVYTTAYLNLFGEGNLRKGETVLIHAGASGVGIAGTQIAKWAGARVIVTVRSDEKKEKIRNLGADIIVSTKTEDIVQVFENNAIDVVLDTLGGEQMGECFARLAPLGRWIVLANLAGNVSQIDLRALHDKRLRLIGSVLRSRTVDEKNAVLKAIVQDVYPQFESGAFAPVIHSIHPISDVEDAHRVLLQNENVGKVVLQIANPE